MSGFPSQHQLWLLLWCEQIFLCLSVLPLPSYVSYFSFCAISLPVFPPSSLDPNISRGDFSFWWWLEGLNKEIWVCVGGSCEMVYVKLYHSVSEHTMCLSMWLCVYKCCCTQCTSKAMLRRRRYIHLGKTFFVGRSMFPCFSFGVEKTESWIIQT